MGQVWRGSHADQDVEVAVKVVLSEDATRTRFQRAFRQEARRMAELYHPSVIDVIDYGELDESAERRSSFHFRAGSPYLVMGYAPRGSLADRLDGPTPWPEARPVLFSLLDALAHSHARGVLHRDIKPGNVLLTGTDSDGGVQLSDFGLAYALRTAQEVAEWHRAAGTPEYMSPEQLTSDWRSYGPPTDLYGLGCLAWEMLTGAPPYQGDNAVQIADAHLRESLPELSDDLDTPPGLERWLQTMLAKQTGDRFQNAADAAWALFNITDEPELDVLDDNDSGSADPTNGNDAPSRHGIHTLRPLKIAEQRGDESGDTGWRGNARMRRSLPRSWRRQDDMRYSVRLPDAGSGIYRFRHFPLIGRADERDLMWERLQTSIDEGRLGLTLLSGPVGIGKDRLAEWLCERSSELGVVDVIRLPHREADDFTDALGRGLERKFGLEGLTRVKVEEFFRELLTDLGADDRYEWRALTELLRPGQETTDGPRVHFRSSKQRHVAVIRFLERLTRRQPVVLYISDAHRGVETLEFIQRLAEGPVGDVPIHVVATVRRDQLADRVPSRRPLEAIGDSPRSREIELGPLAEAEIRQLLEEALFLEPATTWEVVRRCGGNPLYALETVGSWIDRDLLTSGDQGYHLPDDVDPPTREESLDIWSDVIDRLVGDRPAARRAMELAATLGERFDRRTWRRAAEFAEVEVPPETTEPFLARDYLRERDDRLVFTQNLLRDALIESADRAGRWQRYCRACARAIDDVEPTAVSDDERIGLLLAEAGDELSACRRLLKAARHYRDRRDYHPLLYLSQRSLEILQDVPESEPPRLRMQLYALQSEARHGFYQNEMALEVAQKGLAIATRLGLEPWIGVMEAYRCAPLNMLSRLDEALEAGRRARIHLEDHVDEFGRFFIRASLMMANVHRRRGEPDEAISRIGDASEALKHVDDPVTRAQVEATRTKIRIQLDQPIHPRELEIQHQRCERLEIAHGRHVTANLRAEVARRNDRLEVARNWYRKAVQSAELVDPDLEVVPRINLALIAIEHGELADAGRRAERVLQNLRRQNRPAMEAHARAAKLPMLAAESDFTELESLLEAIETFIERTGSFQSADLALCIKTALEHLPNDENGHGALRDRLQSALAVVEQ